MHSVGLAATLPIVESTYSDRRKRAILIERSGRTEAEDGIARGSHIQPLTAWVENLRGRYTEFHIPNFDPLDGGVNAELLLLLQDPGPRVRDTDFVSRNNPDPTAKVVCESMSNAGILRERTALWNVMPWAGGHVGFCEENYELILGDLTRHFQQLKIIVLGGKVAQRFEKCLVRDGIEIAKLPHPSGRNWKYRPAFAEGLKQLGSQL